MAIKYHFEVLNINKDWTKAESLGAGSAPKKVNNPNPSPMVVKKSSSPSPKPKPQAQPKIDKCPVCNQIVAFPAVLFHVAQHHFSQLLASAKVPVEAPFKCPRCPHFADSYGTMLKHFLIFHKQLEAMTEKLKNPEEHTAEVKVTNAMMIFRRCSANALSRISVAVFAILSILIFMVRFGCVCASISTQKQSVFSQLVSPFLLQSEIEDNKPLVVRQDFSSKGPFQCLLCDDTPTIGQTSYDFHKHLCESHFRERLLAAIPLLENTQPKEVSPDVQANVQPRKYGCPVPGCGYELPQRWVMAKHYGLKHQVAKQIYMKICDFSSNNTSISVETTDTEEDLDDTFDEDSFDENEALQQITTTTTNELNTEQNGIQAYQVPSDHHPNVEQTPSKSSEYLEEMPSNNSDSKSYHCKVCDFKTRGLSEYLKHLSKIHFKHKLSEMVPKTPPYKCPFQGCDVVKKDRYNISLHYGMSHKVALKLMQEMPEDALNEASEAVCKVCNQSFTAHRYLFTHLSDAHFQQELDAELPTQAPWKCPKCAYLGNDIRALRVHYGVRHKAVLEHLAAKLGMNILSLKKEMKAGRKKAVTALKSTIRNKEIARQGGLQQQQDPVQNSDSKINNDMNFLQSQKTVVTTNPNPNPVQEPSAAAVTAKLNEDKKFPQCRLCNYRYFTRLDLCRHFVDYHLRHRLQNFLHPQDTRCPACTLSYEKKQSRLRHYIWSHQDLEGLVVQDSGVRLSEFMPSLRDLDIVRQKNEMRSNPEAKLDFKDITDLAALPVYDFIDVKLQNGSCELCGEEFKSGNKSREKTLHLMGHFKEEIFKDLPTHRPYKCPKCTYTGKDQADLGKHYALNHKAVFLAMQRELGDAWSIGDLNENTECKVCGQAFTTARALTDHYCSIHFYAKIAENLPSEAPFNCPQCKFSCKTQLALVRHLGNKHKLVTKILLEQGYDSFSRRSSSASQDSSHFDYYQQQQQHNSWVEHYQYQPQQQHYNQNSHGFTSPEPQVPQVPHVPQVPQVPQVPPEQTGTPQAQQPQLPQVNLQIPQVPNFQDQFQPPPPQPTESWKSPEHLDQPASAPVPQAPPQPAQPPSAKADKVTTRSDQTPVACPICTSTFLNGTHFLRHAADKHFFDRMKADLPQVAPFKCPYCTWLGKDLKLLVRHYGMQHKMVLKLLNERAGN